MRKNVSVGKVTSRRMLEKKQATKTFGTTKNGTLQICRAKPENRGRYNCKHGEHVVFTQDELKNNAVQKFNEKVLAKTHNIVRVKNKSSLPNNFSLDNIQNSSSSVSLTKKELDEVSNSLASEFNTDDYEFIKDFYENYSNVLSDEISNRKFDHASVKVHEYLVSDDETAVKTREFLGKNVDMEDFSVLLVANVGSMTKSYKWDIRQNTNTRRTVMSTIDNDMTKERYVASVMFFGGRCCYCNKVLRKGPPISHQASGEHITPISPQNKETTPGTTRYGNMALACVKCNNSRKNEDLTEWLSKTKMVREEEKPKVLARIKAFRKFALYSENDPSRTVKINNVIEELDNKISEYKDSSGAWLTERNGKPLSTRTINQEIKDKIAVAIHKLKFGE